MSSLQLEEILCDCLRAGDAVKWTCRVASRLPDEHKKKAKKKRHEFNVLDDILQLSF